MYYFAYGSNMSAERLRDERGVEFESRNKAVLNGYKMVFNKMSATNPLMGVSNIIKNSDSKVEGIIYKVKESDFDIIDVYERCPEHYQRHTVKVIVDDKELDATTYIATKNHTFQDDKPHPVPFKYFNKLLVANDYLSDKYLKQVRQKKYFKLND